MIRGHILWIFMISHIGDWQLGAQVIWLGRAICIWCVVSVSVLLETIIFLEWLRRSVILPDPGHSHL